MKDQLKAEFIKKELREDELKEKPLSKESQGHSEFPKDELRTKDQGERLKISHKIQQEKPEKFSRSMSVSGELSSLENPDSALSKESRLHIWSNPQSHLLEDEGSNFKHDFDLSEDVTGLDSNPSLLDHQGDFDEEEIARAIKASLEDAEGISGFLKQESDDIFDEDLGGPAKRGPLDGYQFAGASSSLGEVKRESDGSLKNDSDELKELFEKEYKSFKSRRLFKTDYPALLANSGNVELNEDREPSGFSIYNPQSINLQDKNIKDKDLDSPAKKSNSRNP